MNFFHTMRLRNKLLLGFAVPALLTALLSALIYNSLNQLEKAFHWIEHTHQAIDHGNSLLSAMIDMETGLRGFLIAGDDVFLEPYHGGKQTFKDTLAEGKKHVNDNPQQVSRLDKIESLKKAWLADHAEPSIRLRNEVNANRSSNSENQASPTMYDVAEFIGLGLGKKSMDELRTVVRDFKEAERKLIVIRDTKAHSISGMNKIVAIGGAVLSVLASLIIVLLITRNIGNQLGTEPATVETIARAIADGDLSQDLHVEKPASGVYAAMQTMQINLKERAELDLQTSALMAQLKQALDSASASIVVTDRELAVIYQNHAAARLFTQAEPELRKVSPSFKASELVGSNIELLRSNESATSSEIMHLQSSLKQDVKFGGITLEQTISPVIDEQGNSIGTVIEWLDKTDQLGVEFEIQSVVDAALAGDLSQRLQLEGKSGFPLMLSERMNALTKVCENVVNDTVRVFSALSLYDLTQSISADYKGSFAEVKTNANQTVTQLTNLIGKVKSDATMLDTASNELRDLNKQLYETAETSSNQASTVSTAAEQISANINGVASASTQMSASINEISRNSADATQIAGEAVSLAESTEITVRQLSQSSNDIGNVIKVINSIAEQTNLLALNATIEAARAGDAGKGFAVVANEVKDLAKETAKATEEIGQKIATIQTDSESAVEAIGGIDKTIQRINDIQVMIAAAVQEQTATTNEISRSVNEAADSSSAIAENSTKAASGAMQALSSTSHAQQSTSELSQLAGELRNLVDQFKVNAA